MTTYTYTVPGSGLVFELASMTSSDARAYDRAQAQSGDEPGSPVYDLQLEQLARIVRSIDGEPVPTDVDARAAWIEDRAAMIDVVRAHVYAHDRRILGPQRLRALHASDETTGA